MPSKFAGNASAGENSSAIHTRLPLHPESVYFAPMFRWSSLFLIVWSLSSVFAASAIQERADRFLKLANAGYQALYRVNTEAQWIAITNVTPQHDAASEAAGKAFAAFNGNPALISEARELLTHKNELSDWLSGS